MNDPFSQLAAQAPSPRDAVLEALVAEVHQDSQKRRSLSRLQRVALSAGALTLGLALTTASAFFATPRAAILAAAALSLSVGGLLLAGVVPGQTRALGLSLRKVLVGLLSVAAFTALGLKAETFVSWAEFAAPDSMHRATACATHSLLSGVVGSTALLFLWRRTDPFSPGVTGSLLGLLGGAVGTTSVSLVCGSAEGLHLTLAHGLSLVVLAAVGVFVGRKWLTP
jgi:hypothetical protein